jgi:hypothetical protein
MARLSASAAALCAILLQGCSGGSETPSSGAPADASAASSSSADEPALPVEEGGPLTQLEPCTPPPEGVEDDVEGLVLPTDAVLTKVEELGSLIRVDAYVEQTPVQVRMFYGDAQGLEIFEIEDEVVEAEVLFGSGAFRSYVKALAVCERGSTVIAFVGPGDGGELPSLGG